MSYDLSRGDWTYTYVLDSGDTEAHIYVGPALQVPSGSLYPTYFTDEEDAETFASKFASSIECFYDDGIPLGATVEYAAAYEVNPGDWGVEAVVVIPADRSYGAISAQIRNVNGGDNAFTNIAIDRNPPSPPPVNTAAGVTLEIYNPSTGAIYSSGAHDILSNTYYETPIRAYPTAMDATFASWYNSYIPNTILSGITNNTAVGVGDYIESMTLEGNTYAGTAVTSEGRYEAWAYGVYRGNAVSGYIRVDVGKYAYPDGYRDFDGDLIIWKYGSLSIDPATFSDQYDVLFPKTLP
jgi:hypothetical protein